MHTAVLGTSTSYQVRPCIIQIESATGPSGDQYANPGTRYEVLTTGSGSQHQWRQVVTTTTPPLATVAKPAIDAGSRSTSIRFTSRGAILASISAPFFR